MSGVFIAHAAADEARAAAIAQALDRAGIEMALGSAGADLVLVCWSQAAVLDPGVIEQADGAKGRGAYFGILLDPAERPFGFGGLQQVDLSGWSGSAGDAVLGELAAAVSERRESGSSGVMALPSLPSGPERASRRPLAVMLAVLAVVVAAGLWFWLGHRGQATPQERIMARAGEMPCAWLNIDPVDNGINGPLALTGVAGDPAGAGRAIGDFAKANQLPIAAVTTDKVARIDPRECAAIDGPIVLRKGPGTRLRVTGEPFVLDAKTHQSLARIQIALAPGDKSVALLGIEPSGKVTWSIPDRSRFAQLKTLDVGFIQTDDSNFEFSIYPDHLGWTGLLLVVGDRPLAQAEPPDTVQRAADFARTLAAATRDGHWDAEMVWFRIDPDHARGPASSE